MNEYQKFSHYGPGGRNCACCGPAPSYRERFDRRVKRREKQQAAKDMWQQLIDDQPYVASPNEWDMMEGE